ncbi:DUF6285 domain-containing protein [Zavarzinia sp. CC-PAN008]|uniref:DUF6285 domain-containing protein n=1 Tax=Zavarzinia sp. CC-PAN008 TaxID=3243332 RepID=UPI003F743CE8
MQDAPTANELLGAIAAFIRDHAMPQLQGHTAFHARVAANAIDIIRRELDIAPAANVAEQARLEALLDAKGTLDALNRQLCARIAEGSITLDTPGLADHLWATTMTKVAIDQPNYSAYRRSLEEGVQPG